MRHLAVSLLSLLVLASSVRGRSAEPTRAPNELGRTPIFEYHKIDVPEARWTRTPEHFRQDLEQLWQRGFRLIALRDFLKGQINVPAGLSPAILTLDDSSPGQFRYLEQNGQLVIDPNCAVGILERFEKDHPGFGHAATFYVLTGAAKPNDLFDQKAYAARKLQYLAEHGYEIGNHTLWHADLTKYPESTVRQQIAFAQRDVDKAVPGYVLHTLALPHGDYPKEIAWAISGSFNGISYKNDAILKVAGPPAISPYDSTFDPYHLPRIQGIDSDLRSLWTDFDKQPGRRFVSDGDPNKITVPAGAKARVKSEFAGKVVEAR